MYVKFTSHRSRDYAMRLLGYVRGSYPQGYYSWDRETGKGTYKLTPEQLEFITGKHLVWFTVLRGPYDDLRKCW